MPDAYDSAAFTQHIHTIAHTHSGAQSRTHTFLLGLVLDRTAAQITKEGVMRFFLKRQWHLGKSTSGFMLCQKMKTRRFNLIVSPLSPCRLATLPPHI